MLVPCAPSAHTQRCDGLRRDDPSLAGECQKARAQVLGRRRGQPEVGRGQPQHEVHGCRLPGHQNDAGQRRAVAEDLRVLATPGDRVSDTKGAVARDGDEATVRLACRHDDRTVGVGCMLGHGEIALAPREHDGTGDGPPHRIDDDEAERGGGRDRVAALGAPLGRDRRRRAGAHGTAVQRGSVRGAVESRRSEPRPREQEHDRQRRGQQRQEESHAHRSAPARRVQPVGELRKQPDRDQKTSEHQDGQPTRPASDRLVAAIKTRSCSCYRFCNRIAPVGQLRSQAMSRVHS